MRGYCSNSVVCPMYKKEFRDRRSICCEGFSEYTRIHTFFLTAEEMDKHKSRYCCDMHGYALCPIFCMASRKYELKP